MRWYKRPVCPESGRGEDVVYLVWSIGNILGVAVAVLVSFFTGIDPVRLRWRCRGCGCSFWKRGS